MAAASCMHYGCHRGLQSPSPHSPLQVPPRGPHKAPPMGSAQQSQVGAAPRNHVSSHGAEGQRCHPPDECRDGSSPSQGPATPSLGCRSQHMFALDLSMGNHGCVEVGHRDTRDARTLHTPSLPAPRVGRARSWRTQLRRNNKGQWMNQNTDVCACVRGRDGAGSWGWTWGPWSRG